MKLGNRLFDMSQQGLVFRAKLGGGTTKTIVPSGPYAGTWTYNNKFLVYDPIIIYDLDRVTEMGRKYTLPMPDWMYDKPAKYWKEQVDNYKMALMKAIWDNWHYKHVKPLEEEAAGYACEVTARFAILNKGTDWAGFHTLVFCLAIAPNTVRQTMYAFPERVEHIIEWIRKSRILWTLGVRKRQRFVERAFGYGIKYAMRKCFSKAYPQTINTAISATVVDCRALSTLRVKADYNVVGFIYDLLRTHPDHKQFYIKLGGKYGNVGLKAYDLYTYERGRATQMGIVLRYPLQQLHSPKVYKTWHDQIAVLVLARQDQLNKMDHEEITKLHADHWGLIPKWDGIRPLITIEDFRQEGETNHHCVAGYFRTIGSLFAHVNYGEEQATVQFTPNEIIQLRGPSNQEVSDGLKQSFGDFYRRLAQPSLDGIKMGEANELAGPHVQQWEV
jgi:PcfJ-like protein